MVWEKNIQIKNEIIEGVADNTMKMIYAYHSEIAKLGPGKKINKCCMHRKIGLQGLFESPL